MLVILGIELWSQQANVSWGICNSSLVCLDCIYLHFAQNDTIKRMLNLLYGCTHNYHRIALIVRLIKKEEILGKFWGCEEQTN